MFTNVKQFGGDFKATVQDNIKNASEVRIATGYASFDILNELYPIFIDTVKDGGSSKILLGMAFYEGLSKPKLQLLQRLSKDLSKNNKESGVFVTYSRRYHGKVYYCKNKDEANYFVGSSNLSTSGLVDNIECNIPATTDGQKKELDQFLDYLFDPDQSTLISKADITVRGSTNYRKKIERFGLEKLDRYNPDDIDKTKYPKLEIPLRRIVDKKKSNLNIYFGKGRWNRKKDTVRPRPWYEVEIICGKDVRESDLYPKGDFMAFTDDGYKMPMRTQGDYNKNLRSRNSLQIFGMWIKGKLQEAEALVPLTMVTEDTLDLYGKDTLDLYKIAEDKYYMDFEAS